MITDIPQQPLDTDRTDTGHTNKDNIEWDYCQIQYQLIDDGRGYTAHNGPSNKLIWFRFVARADGPRGKYIAAQAPKTPLPNMMGTTWSPDQHNIGYQNMLHTLVETLQQDGWELMPGTHGAWWSKRLQRPASARTHKRWQIRKWLQPIAMFLAFFALGCFSIYYLNTPFRNGVSQFISLPVTDTPAEPYRAGKILPVNLNTGRLDPIYHQLPETIRAANSNQVSTLVWIDCKLNANWRNTHNNCELSVIDYTQQTKLAVHEFPGTQKGKPNGTDILQYRDEAKMVEYILNLPPK